MFVLPERINEVTIDALQKLATRDDMPADARMELQVAAIVLGYARHLNTAGAELMRAHSREAADLLGTLHATLADNPAALPLRDTLQALRNEAGEIADSSHSVPVLQGRFDDFLGELDHALAGAQHGVMGAAGARLMAWQVGLNTLSQVPATSSATAERDLSVKLADLQALLRERLGDPTLVVSDWTALPGGFGKETCLFKARSERGTLELVMRRDAPTSLIKGVDCHEVKQEYPLLKAVHALGFPVPEPVLLETDSRVVSGPDFLIMHRVSGRVEGDVMGGSGQVPTETQRKLAEVTARLHQLPPLPELGDGSRELRSELWQLSSAECTRRYITTWYQLYCSRGHMAMPAVHSMFRWLLDHVPESSDRPALVHGDIGLHNLLFDNGQLTSLLDWEFAHIGDPLEDLGIIRTVMGRQLDWNTFASAYRAAGGVVPDERRIRYFEIWMNLRNLAIASIALEQFARGQLNQIRYGVFATRFIPYYVETVTTLIREWESA